MKVRTLACGFVLGVVTAFAGSVAFSQDKGGLGGEQAMPDAAEMQKMMEAWKKTMTPGEHHKAMQGSVGTWDGTFKMMGAPGMPGTESKIVAERTWVLDGRFVLETIKGQMPMPDFATGATTNVNWEGMGLTGYDNYRNMYVGCWADNMGTQLLTFKGTASPDGKSFTYYGEMDEPMLSVAGRTVKYVTTIIDADHQTFSIYDLAVSDDYKVIEIAFTRRK